MNNNDIDITGLDKADVLAALHNRARVQGVGVIHATPEDMTREVALAILDKRDGNLYFDYLKGRVMKVDISRDSFNPGLYDRDNGPGAASAVIEKLR